MSLMYPLIRKIKEKKYKRNINNNLAVLPSHDKDVGKEQGILPISEH